MGYHSSFLSQNFPMNNGACSASATIKSPTLYQRATQRASRGLSELAELLVIYYVGNV